MLTVIGSIWYTELSVLYGKKRQGMNDDWKFIDRDPVRRYSSVEVFHGLDGPLIFRRDNTLQSRRNGMDPQHHASLLLFRGVNPNNT